MRRARLGARRILDECAHRLRRAGLYRTRTRRAIWVHGGTLQAFDDAAGLIQGLHRAFPFNRVVFTCPTLDTYRRLRARDPGQLVVAAPWGVAPAVRRLLRALDPVLLIWLGFDDTLPLAALRAARRRALPVVVVDGRLPASDRFVRRAAPLVDRFCMRAPEAAERLRALGAAAVAVTGALRAEPPDADGRTPTWRHLEPVLARVPRAVRGAVPKRPERRASRTPVARWIAATRAGGRIAGWEALARRLGEPETILCLGNGPSSEDPQVLAVRHDCLMRVNWRWLDRGLLTDPDVVFVGDPATVDTVPACVFGFRTIRKEREALLRHLFRGRRLRALEHFTLERVPSLLGRAWPATPTAGATMIVTAARLGPKRLVIAGIDLFSDPRGRYPGDPLGQNAYSERHDRHVDLDIIDAALREFAGRVVLLSPMLERALGERRAARTRAHPEPPSPS